MANSFKPLLGEDIATTRTLLHEAIPITGTIVSGTYTDDSNIKTFRHGMYEAVYDYPYLSSSANHIFDITAGYSSGSSLSSSDNTQNAKKINIYNQMAQVLVGYDASGQIQEFDADADLSTDGDKMRECLFLSFSRLLAKDEIKKDSFRLALFPSASNVYGAGNKGTLKTIGDYGAQTAYYTNSPAGEYGLLYTSSDGDEAQMIIGHVYYQAGLAVLTASYFSGAFGDPDSMPDGALYKEKTAINYALTSSTITSEGTRLNI